MGQSGGGGGDGGGGTMAPGRRRAIVCKSVQLYASERAASSLAVFISRSSFPSADSSTPRAGVQTTLVGSEQQQQQQQRHLQWPNERAR